MADKDCRNTRVINAAAPHATASLLLFCPASIHRCTWLLQADGFLWHHAMGHVMHTIVLLHHENAHKSAWCPRTVCIGAAAPNHQCRLRAPALSCSIVERSNCICCTDATRCICPIKADKIHVDTRGRWAIQRAQGQDGCTNIVELSLKFFNSLHGVENRCSTL